jgi:dihydropteroate synthase
MHIHRRILLLALCFAIAAPARALEAGRDDVRAFIADMAEKHGFAAIVRAHDVAATVDAVKVASALKRAATGG